ncbi:Phosphate transporter PHO1-like 8, partial [Cucurbita argyrosperma subsp. argyrosperma]
MKFGKEFLSQMVPEWQEAYLDYSHLKTVLKEVSRARQPEASNGTTRNLKRRVSLYRAFSGLAGPRRSQQMQEDAIHTNIIHTGSEECYQSMLFASSSEQSDEHQVEFFRRLDDEFNKVVGFYKKEVAELMGEAEELSKQIDILIALRIKVEQPDIALEDFNESVSLTVTKMNVFVERSSLEVTQEVEMETREAKSNSRKASGGIAHPTIQKLKLELLSQVRINVHPETPISTLKCMVMSSKSQLSYNKTELRKAEELMKRAFIEFYQKLRVLKGYSLLNKLAVSKIMKKYDKITSRKASKAYLEMVEKSPLGSILESQGRGQYMDNIFPLYSLFGFIVLHMLIYSANLYFWRRYHVNYTLMFGFKQGTELGYWEVFFLSSGLAVITMACILSNLDMEADPRTRTFAAITESVPLALLIALLFLIFCPFDILFRPSRFFLIRSAFHLVCAPLYKVSLQDFFLADQLTSQVQAFRSLQFYVCYYGWGDFIRRSNKCFESRIFEAFYFVVAIIPYWIRTLQCLRRLVEEKDVEHVFNGLKYFSTIVAIAMRTGHDLNMGMIWRILAAISSGTATISGTYWDIVQDWGLLQRNSKNPWLRDKLLISNKNVYYVAIGLNILLRLAWMQSVLGFREAPFIHRQALIAIVAVLEIIRRGIWNFFRMENEHLNNVGKFRAFNSVPLPFEFDDNNNKMRTRL